MNKISHKQAIQWIDRRLDGLLTTKQRLSLEEHLHLCDSCRAYAAEMDLLPTQLQNEFHTRWDAKHGPSPKIMQQVTTRAGNITTKNHAYSITELFAGALMLVVLALAINFAVSQLRNTSIAATGTEVVNVSSRAEDRLLVFPMEQNGNYDIAVMHADGSGLTNLTNDPASDTYPVWSPDGEQIAFESDRSGLTQIYLINPDGSNLIQLTGDKANHGFVPLFGDSFRRSSSDVQKFVLAEASDGESAPMYGNHPSPFSPDGSKLIISEWISRNAETLYVMDLHEKNKKQLVSEPGVYSDLSWSPDGTHVAFLAGDAINSKTRLYVANADGSNLIDVTESLSMNVWTSMSPLSYDWSQDGQSIFFVTRDTTPLQSTVYEARLVDSQLVERATSGNILADWWDTRDIITGTGNGEPPLEWFRFANLDAFEHCNPVDEAQSALTYKRSANGNAAIAVHCPSGDWWFYWANPDGTGLKSLLNSPLPGTALAHEHSIVWAPDNRYIAFNSRRYDDKTNPWMLKHNLYVLDVEKALVDPSSQVIQIPVNSDRRYGTPSWQPVINHKVAEKEPTPRPSSQAENRLLAFTLDVNGNSDIYTMHADGSGLTNLTDNPAFDGHPFWSPDGNQIAFTSDRSGTMQIYLMDADGSNVTQLTNEEGNSQFDVNGNTPWSPDGKELIFVQSFDGEHGYKLYSMDIEKKIKTTLTTEPGEYLLPSWSPDGEHIAFTSYASQENPDIRQLFFVDKNGNHLTKLTESLPKDESFTTWNYYWSQNGQSVFFTADSNDPQGDTTTVYEASLDGSLNVITRASRSMLDWWNGTTLKLEGPGGTLTWLRSDGSTTTLDLCQSTDQALGVAHKRSHIGNLVVGSNCSATGWTFYWANPDGTLTGKLASSAMPVRNDTIFNMTWSPDDNFIAIAALDTDMTSAIGSLYILNVAEARNDPGIQPLEIAGGYSPSWQPIWNPEVVEERPTPTDTPATTDIPTLIPTDTPVAIDSPTPEPTQPVASQEHLLAFASIQNGNSDIYTMHADGSELTNLTNHPARDINPYWSPDGRRVAFESDRDGFTHIFLIDSDGSNIVQVTNGEAQHQFSNANPWSPNGSKLLFTEWTPDEEKWMLVTSDVNGQNKIPLTEVPNTYSNPSWSPDGQHVVFLADDPQNTGDNRLYVVDADGQNRRELTQSFQADEQLSSMEYDWSPDGQSIFFISLLQTTDPSWTVYESRVADSSLITRAATKTPLFDWWNDISVVSPFIWKRSEETLSTLDPYNNCQQTDAAQSGSYMKRSPNGAWLISVYCANGDVWLYWVRSDGMLNRQLLDVPIPSEQRTFSDLIWSPDEKFVALNILSNNRMDMYILDVEASLNDPSTQPLKVTVSDGNLFSNISWQPNP